MANNLTISTLEADNRTLPNNTWSIESPLNATESTYTLCHITKIPAPASSVELNTPCQTAGDIGYAATVLLGIDISILHSWSTARALPIFSLPDNLYTLALLSHYSISKPNLIENFLKRNPDLFSILAEFPRFLLRIIEFNDLTLDHFSDQTEGMEFLIVNLLVKEIDEDQTNNIENYILDEYFYPRSKVVRERLVFSM